MILLEDYDFLIKEGSESSPKEIGICYEGNPFGEDDISVEINGSRVVILSAKESIVFEVNQTILIELLSVDCLFFIDLIAKKEKKAPIVKVL
jgi:hypothetical protein